MASESSNPYSLPEIYHNFLHFFLKIYGIFFIPNILKIKDPTNNRMNMMRKNI